MPARRELNYRGSVLGWYRVAVVLLSGACGVQGVPDEPVARIAPPMPITSAEQTVASTGVTPAVATNGSVFLLVWSDGTDIYGSRIDAVGTILDSIAISTAAASRASRRSHRTALTSS
jgi:hypothetical protein